MCSYSRKRNVPCWIVNRFLKERNVTHLNEIELPLLHIWVRQSKKKKKELSWVALSQGHSTSASFSFIPANILELLRVLIIADINMKRKKKIVCRGCPDQMHGRCRRARGRRFTNSKVSSVVPSEYLGHTYKEVGDFIHVSLVTSPQRGI